MGLYGIICRQKTGETFKNSGWIGKIVCLKKNKKKVVKMTMDKVATGRVWELDVKEGEKRGGGRGEGGD